MDERSLQSIKEHLQKEDAQKRILQHIQKGRAEATVTISRAAELFEFTENKLRDWEKYGFLNPLRPVGPMGRRLYTLRDLDKLAIIRELIDTGYAPSDIPADIDEIWFSICFPEGQHFATNSIPPLAIQTRKRGHSQSINMRVTQALSTSFLRYFASHALRLSLMLICEDIPDASAGLLLPLEANTQGIVLQNVEDLAELGETLVGWWSNQEHSWHTLLTSTPSFQYNTDYRMHPLQIMKSGISQETHPRDNTLIVIPRETKPLTITPDVVETIRRFLHPLYNNVQNVLFCFGPAMHDEVELSTDPGSSSKHEDSILNGLAEIVIDLGGQTTEGRPHWSFCCILLPHSPVLSLQQNSLVVRAQSKHSPYQINTTTFSSFSPTTDVCISAFQSGRIFYTPTLYLDDATSSPRGLKGPLGSTVAVPVENSDGTSVAVLYVVSEYTNAFSETDQRVFRMVGRMIGELLEVYHARRLTIRELRNIIASPSIVDTLFEKFPSENKFIDDIEELLMKIQTSPEDQLKEVVSFIVVDVDNQSSFANKYGNRVARNLSRVVGLRIDSQLRTFKDDADYKLYHFAADRFYISLKRLSLEQARIKAELLRQVLCGSYQIDPLSVPVGQPTLPESMLTLSNVTVRLGVASYFYWKLKEVMQRFPTEISVVQVRMQIISSLDEALNLGKRLGGNVVMSWEPESRNFIPWSPHR